MARTRKGVIAAAGALSLAALVLTGCAGNNGNPLSNDSGSKGSSGTITVGSAAFPENAILAYIYADALSDAGVKTDVKANIGQRDRYIAALKNDEIQLVPEYTGNLLQFLDSTSKVSSSDEVYSALQTAVKNGGGGKLDAGKAEVLDQAPGQDADSYNVTKKFSDDNHVTSLADLKNVKGELKVAANPEFATRPYGIPGLKSTYGVSATLTPINDSGGANTLKALLDGSVQLADIYSSDPSIAKNNLVTLADPQHLIAAQNVVPLISSKVASAKVKDTLNKVSAKLTTDQLSDMLKKSYNDKEASDQIAKEWVKANGF
ncbi:ABC transporter substrate-binding protein [Gryllotalpicola daejeonensis]|uniref:ABC transporter substrate-binding protein n=1 Tax=Gryllotalpicola daejeonensis TaxID=993087 RepID=A0ABP7ZFT0_9MICO